MEMKEIQELIKLVSKTNIAELKIKEGDFSITIRTVNENDGKYVVAQAPMAVAPAPIQAAPVQVAAPQAPAAEAPAPTKVEAAAPKGVYIKSPIVGTFYRSSSPDKPPFVKVGDVIEKGSVVCIVEAMKLFNEIESEVSGTIVKILVDDRSPVEYDQALFVVEPK
jgi:acetyl-CoA carboxylase biotin carboxyl carrier protein